MSNVIKRKIWTLWLIAFCAAALPLQAAQTVLITGANRGIGLALAEAFSKEGYNVIGTAREPDTATALKALGARVEQLDVASQASVDALANRLDDQSIDVLINNAGIIGHDEKEIATLKVDELNVVLNVNTLGPLRVCQALLPNVERSERKIVVNISSMMGSMELNTWGCCLGCRASKAALNSINKTLAVDLADRGLTFVVLHPGYVQTDMNDGQGEITPSRSGAGLFSVIDSLDASSNGGFYDYQGRPMPW